MSSARKALRRVTSTGALRRRCFAAALVLLSTTPVDGLVAQAPPGAKPQSTHLGFAPDRLTRIDQFLQRAVDSNQIAGAVALIMRDGQVAYERAFGWSDREAKRRMTTDAIFRIASQSKAITSVAILSLVEEGKIGLRDPVSRWIPSFAHTTVATKSDTGRVIVPAKRQITVFDLLTHTGGVSYGTGGLVAPLYAAKGLGPAAGSGLGFYFADKDEPICASIDRLGTLPFVAQPGEKWVYGYSLDVLGCVVERASGMPLDQFIAQRITGPLDMKDTHFFLPPGDRARLAAVYSSDSTGHAVRAPNGPLGQGNYVDGPRKSLSGGAGLLSTARDYARFLQMLLNGGELGGIRILAPKTVDLMTHNQIGKIFDPEEGVGWGLGFETVERFGADGMASAGTFEWGGAYASAYKVDPKEQIVMVFMIQMLPDRSNVAARFPTLMYQALVDPAH